MKKIILLIVIILMAGIVYPAEKTVDSVSYQGTSKDTILIKYTDDEFKQAIMQILQKGNLTNRKLFIKQLEIVRKGSTEKKEKLYGLANINKENSKGMTGWDVATSGIIVVFSGLMLIMLVLYLFNYMFKPKTAEKAKPENARRIVEEIPEDILVAIATAVELYTRLYSTEKLKDLSFKTKESESWKIKNKFVQGS